MGDKFSNGQGGDIRVNASPCKIDHSLSEHPPTPLMQHAPTLEIHGPIATLCLQRPASANKIPRMTWECYGNMWTP